MKIEEFIKNIEHISSIISCPLPTNIQKADNLPYILAIMENISYLYKNNDTRNIIDIKKIIDGYVVFNLYCYADLDLYIKKEDISNEEIIVYYLNEKDIQVFSKYLSIVLLVNLSLWIFDNKTTHKILFKEKTMEFYEFTKNNYSFVCGDHSLINQIYFSSTSFMVFIYRNKEYFIIAKDFLSLNNLQQQIDTIKDDTKKTVAKRIKIVSDFIKNTKTTQDEHVLIGKITIDNRNIEVEIESEQNITENSDFDKLIQPLKEIEDYYCNNKNILHSEIVAEVIDDMYQQSDNKLNNNEHEEFKKYMKLKKIEVFADGFMLIYEIKTDRDEKMYVQLNNSFIIEEITIN
jgi:hypothetical protein